MEALQTGAELAAKHAAEDFHRQKERISRAHPMAVIERQSASGDHTMGVRVMFEFLIPGVEHTEEADLGAKMLGIASDFEEGFGSGLQQQIVQEFLVLQGERRQFMR